jgi:hypothetical protein
MLKMAPLPEARLSVYISAANASINCVNNEWPQLTPSLRLFDLKGSDNGAGLCLLWGGRNKVKVFLVSL